MKSFYVFAIMLFSFLFPPASMAASTVSFAKVEVPVQTSVNWYNGTVSSRQDAEISAEVSGRITWMADFGERVKTGDVLARIDDRQLKLKLQSSMLELSKARQNRNYLKTELDRLEALHKKNSISKTELDSARHHYLQAKLDVEFASVQSSILQDQLSRTEVKAPFSGVINNRSIQPSEHVSAGDILLQLVNPDNADIRVQLPIELVDSLSYQAKLSVLTEEKEQVAVVSRKGASADARSRLVEMRLDPEGGNWLPGSPVRVAIPVSLPAVAKVVPRDAVVMGPDGNAVFKIETSASGDKTVRKISVDVLYGDDEKVSVDGDITEGDLVVVRGASTLKDNDPVVFMEKSVGVL